MSKILVKLFPTPEKQEKPENIQEEVQGTLPLSSIYNYRQHYKTPKKNFIEDFARGVKKEG